MNGESSRSTLGLQVASGKLCQLASWDRSGIFSLFQMYRSSLVSSMFVDMLVAARYNMTVVGVHSGSSEGA